MMTLAEEGEEDENAEPDQTTWSLTISPTPAASTSQRQCRHSIRNNH